MRKQPAYRRKKGKNVFSMALVGIAVIMILIVVLVRGYDIRERLDVYEKRGQELQAQIDEEEKRAKELEEFEKYTQTKEYMKEIAEDQLGLVDKDVIVLKPEQ